MTLLRASWPNYLFGGASALGCALYAGIGGALVAGLLLFSVLGAWCVAVYWRKLNWLTRGAIVLCITVSAWFGTVDRFIREVQCQTCGRLRLTQDNVRVFTVPVYGIWHRPVTNHGLDIPCAHDNEAITIEQRHIGLFFCCFPCESGVRAVVGPRATEMELQPISDDL